MLFHQLPCPFQILLFQGFCPSDEGLLHRLYSDQVPHPGIFRNVRTQSGVRGAHRIDLAALRAAEEGELDVTLLTGLRHDGLRYSGAFIALYLQDFLLFLNNHPLNCKFRPILLTPSSVSAILKTTKGG